MTVTQDDESRRSTLYDTIARHLLDEPQMVARLDVSLLVTDPGFWDNIEHFVRAITTRLQAHHADCTAWLALRPGLKAYLLGDNVGMVVAFAKTSGQDQSTAYMLVVPTGLEYRPPLDRETMEAAEATSNQDEVAAVKAMEGELKLFDFMVTHVAATCDIIEQDKRLLAEIRQILWELKVFSWAPTERFMQMARVQALFTVVAKNSGYQLEDILSDSRRAHRLS